MRPRVSGPGSNCILAPVAALLLGACASAGDSGHSLDGRIWSTAASNFVERGVVETAVGDARYVLLGETHDIPAHHEGQAELVGAASRQRRPAIVFEMMRHDQQRAIDRWRAEGADPATLGKRTEWEKRGWPDWSMYRPIIETAVALDLPVYGGAPDRETLQAVGHEGLAALAAERRRELRLDRPLPTTGRKRLEEVLRGAHCGMSGDGMLTAMVGVQRLRDAFLAERLRTAAERHGAAILIAGRGHTREDHGVPLYLDAQGTGEQVAVGFVGIGEFGDVATLREAGDGAIAHDYVWFTVGGRPAPGCADLQAGN